MDSMTIVNYLVLYTGRFLRPECSHPKEKKKDNYEVIETLTNPNIAITAQHTRNNPHLITLNNGASQP